MRGRPLGPAKSDFGQWLIDNLTRYEQSLRGLGELADLSHARISQYIAGEEPPRQSVERLARAFVPADLDEHEAEETYQRLANAALRSAGYLPSGDLPALVYEPILDELRGASYDGVLDGEFVQEIAEDIRRQAERRRRRMGRD